MNTTIIILCAIIYVLMAIISYRSFKILERNDVIASPLIAIMLWPIAWTTLLAMTIALGFVELFKRE